MSPAARTDAYLAQTGRHELTPRQRRRVVKKSRHATVLGSPDPEVV